MHEEVKRGDWPMEPRHLEGLECFSSSNQVLVCFAGLGQFSFGPYLPGLKEPRQGTTNADSDIDLR